LPKLAQLPPCPARLPFAWAGRGLRNRPNDGQKPHRHTRRLPTNTPCRTTQTMWPTAECCEAPRIHPLPTRYESGRRSPKPNFFSVLGFRPCSCWPVQWRVRPLQRGGTTWAQNLPTPLRTSRGAEASQRRPTCKGWETNRGQVQARSPSGLPSPHLTPPGTGPPGNAHGLCESSPPAGRCRQRPDPETRNPAGAPGPPVHPTSRVSLRPPTPGIYQLFPVLPMLASTTPQPPAARYLTC